VRRFSFGYSRYRVSGSFGDPGRRERLLGSYRLDTTKIEHWRYFILGTMTGAFIVGFVVSMMTQWVEHGDALYPARTRMSKKGRRVRYDLL
jgi:hypothetical protein